MSLVSETVAVKVGEDIYSLVPSLGAVTAISQTLNGPLAAIEQLRGMNIIAITSVVAAGAQLDRKEAAAVSEAIFETGSLDSVAASCIEYCLLLMNGGKRDKPKDKPGKKPDATKS